MGFTFDDINNPGLVLGLGFSSSTDKKKPTGVKPEQPVSLIFEPSLTLSLSGDAYEKNKAVHIIEEKKVISDKEDIDYDLCRQDSVVSTISNVVDHVSIKRERSEDEVVDDDDDFNARKKLRLTKAQSAMLEESFKHRSTLNPKQKQELAKELNLRPRQVEVWFQNRRARTKLKQTEVDCELLKKCCETLTEENRRLQKELQELKAMKGLTNPFYMQLPPPGNLTTCPSCERIAGVVVGEKASKINTFNMAPKHHLLNPFANHPAAC